MKRREAIWEVTYVEVGKTFYWTTRKCHSEFGKAEFLEIKDGNLPHIVAVKVSR